MQDEPQTMMATVVKKSYSENEFKSPDVVKAIVDEKHFALYFSRSAIPTFFTPSQNENFFYKHIGLYAFNKDFLFTFKKLPVLALEKYERLEQLRALEHGYKIRVIESKFETIGIDTPQDLELAKILLQEESAIKASADPSREQMFSGGQGANA